MQEIGQQVLSTVLSHHGIFLGGDIFDEYGQPFIILSPYMRMERS